MAWLEKHPTSGRYKICFRWKGRQYKKTVKTTDQGDAEAILRRLEENVGLFDRGFISFGDDGSILVSPALPRDKIDLLGVTENGKLTVVQEAHKPFLGFHREWVFFCAATTISNAGAEGRRGWPVVSGDDAG